MNKISSYIVKYFFYYMCNIFVLILYIKNKQGVPPICAFFVSRHYLFILVFLTPVKSLFSVN